MKEPLSAMGTQGTTPLTALSSSYCVNRQVFEQFSAVLHIADRV